MRALCITQAEEDAWKAEHRAVFDVMYAELVQIVPGGEEALLGEWRDAMTALCTSYNRAAAIGTVGNALRESAGMGMPGAVAQELAIACQTAALEVYTRDAYPEKWAEAQTNLAASAVAHDREKESCGPQSSALSP